MKIKVGEIPFSTLDTICADNSWCGKCPMLSKDGKEKCMGYKKEYDDVEVEVDESYILDKTPKNLFVDQIIKKEDPK